MPRRPSDPHDLIGEILGDVPLGSFPSMAEAQRQIESRLRMLPRLRWPAGYIEDVRRMNKVIDERDVRPLETLRYVLLFAKLIHKRKGFFNISPAGRALLDDARRGELLALLFRMFFRALDLRDVDGWDGDGGLQQTITYTFWRLRREAKDWTSPAHLVETAWLNDAKDSILPPFAGDGTRFRAARLERRVLEPLVSLGVLESRDRPSANRWERPIEVRPTPLFDRLMRFAL